MGDHFTRAIAVHLAAGDVDRATALSAHFMPGDDAEEQLKLDLVDLDPGGTDTTAGLPRRLHHTRPVHPIVAGVQLHHVQLCDARACGFT